MKKILVIDDEPSIILTLEFFLKKEDYEVKSANSAEEAIKKIEQFSPDILVTDIALPKKNGLELAKEIRAKEKFKKLPIIGISAYGMGENNKSQNACFNVYFSKPFSLEELKQSIKTLI